MGLAALFTAGSSLALRRELVSLLLSSKVSSFPAYFNKAINHVRAALFLSRRVWVVPTKIGLQLPTEVSCFYCVCLMVSETFVVCILLAQEWPGCGEDPWRRSQYK